MRKKIKNKKGFTLIELLATILILAVVVSLTITSVIGFLGNAKLKSYQTTVKNIENVATVFLKENTDKISFVGTGEIQYQCIKVKHLIDSGYFDNEILKSQISNDKNVNPEMYVYVTRDNNTKVVKTAKLIYDDVNSLNTYCHDITGSLGKNITFDYERGWAKSKEIKIKYELLNIADQGQLSKHSYSYSIEGKEKVNKIFNSGSVTEKITVNSMVTIQAVIKDNKNDNFIKSITISKIDNDAPKIIDLKGDTKYEQVKNIIVSIEEVVKGSGFNPQDKTQTVKYGWSTSNTKEPTDYHEGVLNYLECTNNTECQKAEFQVNGEGMTGEYYLWIKPVLQDIVGNVVESAVSTGTYKFDNEQPIVNISRKDYNTIDSSKSTDNVSSLLYYYNKENIELGDNINWVNNNTYDIASDGTYYVWARDDAGNISEPKSIVAYKVTRTEGTGTTLKTLYENSTGEEFKTDTYVLKGTPIYITGILKTGYNNLLLKYNEETISSKTTKTVNEDAIITSSAVVIMPPPPVLTVTDFCVKKGVVLTDLITGYASATSNAKITTSPETISTSSTGKKEITYTATDEFGQTTSKTVTITIFTHLNEEITTLKKNNGLYDDGYMENRYIYRGADPNNYLKVGNKFWRIVAINPDGSYKIVATESIGNRQFNSSGSNKFANSDLEKYLNNDYSLNVTLKNNIVSGQYFDGNFDGASNNSAMANYISKDRSTIYTGKVALLSASDYILASKHSNCTNYYYSYNKVNNVIPCSTQNYLYKSSGSHWWLLNGHTNGNVRLMGIDGNLKNLPATGSYAVYPVVTLGSSTNFIGAGTKSNPYTIVTNCKSKYTCSISTEDGYQNPQTLTVNVKDANGNSANSSVTYSFDGEEYKKNNVKTVEKEGTFNVIIKDSDGFTNSCSITLNSQSQWRSATCSNNNITYGWKLQTSGFAESCSADSDDASLKKCPDVRQYKISNCPAWNGTHTSNTSTSCSNICNEMLTDECGIYKTATCTCNVKYEIYDRTCSCNKWGAFSAWGTKKITKSCSVNVETRTAYGRG